MEIEAVEELTRHQSRSRDPRWDLGRVSWAEASASVACTPKESHRGPLTDRSRLKIRLRSRRTLKSRRLERPRCGCVSAITENHLPAAAAPLPHPASEQWPPTHLAHRKNEHPPLPPAPLRIQEE